eukprot:m.267969 g.267969  ORF g.267969 m.267969 type:complete len:1177 (+) comp19290_c0_seq13:198-3728(+)
MPDDAAGVKVAVRVRPFNSREEKRNAKLIIAMDGNVTTIQDPSKPDEPPRKFTFDYSYWSHDGFVKREGDEYLLPADDRYADQERVFRDLGQGVLDNAFAGFNTSLFAYGQTGSGKSYSMVGYGANTGIVPVTCEHLFRAIVESESTTKRFQVTFSMLEIYNERVRDLLVANPPPSGLQVRQRGRGGAFFAVGLTRVPVASYDEINRRMEQGTKNRTTASTNMNATSSRAHTIVTIQFDQITLEGGRETTKSSEINLVDLAGSERASSTGAQGDRLKEGSAINQSLSALGKVISALADESLGKQKVHVPYRESMLTRLLANALGGNSKTVMIAALSPADINHDETLSTLRYADRAKKIKTKAVINENPTDKLIRELKEENARLKAKLDGSGSDDTGGTNDVTPAGPTMLDAAMIESLRLKVENEMRAKLLADQTPQEPQGLSAEEVAAMQTKMQAQMEEQLQRDLQAKLDEEKARLDEERATMQAQLEENLRTLKLDMEWEEAQRRARDEEQALDKEHDELERKRRTVPHLVNLNEDPQLSHVICHFLDKPANVLGLRDDGDPPDIQLRGIKLRKRHAVIMMEEERGSIQCTAPGATVKLNGRRLNDETELRHLDRLLFGSNLLFLYINPLAPQLTSKGTPADVDWDFAMDEIARFEGFDTNTSGLTLEQLRTRDQVLELLPMISEANAISEEMLKKRKFEVALLSPLFMGRPRGSPTEVQVLVTNEHNKNTSFWGRGKFMDKRYQFQDMYQMWVDDDVEEPEAMMGLPEDDMDPFYEAAGDVLVGISSFQLSTLAFCMDNTDTRMLTNHMGGDEGSVTAALVPCTLQGQPRNDYIEDPNDFVGEQFSFQVNLQSVYVKSARFTSGLYCRFCGRDEGEQYESRMVAGTDTVVFDQTFQIDFEKVTEEVLHWLENGWLTIRVFGRQRETVADAKLSRIHKEQIKRETGKGTAASGANGESNESDEGGESGQSGEDDSDTDDGGHSITHSDDGNSDSDRRDNDCSDNDSDKAEETEPAVRVDEPSCAANVSGAGQRLAPAGQVPVGVAAAANKANLAVAGTARTRVVPSPSAASVPESVPATAQPHQPAVPAEDVRVTQAVQALQGWAGKSPEEHTFHGLFQDLRSILVAPDSAAWQATKLPVSHLEEAVVKRADTPGHVPVHPQLQSQRQSQVCVLL